MTKADQIGITFGALVAGFMLGWVVQPTTTQAILTRSEVAVETIIEVPVPVVIDRVVEKVVMVEREPTPFPQQCVVTR